MVRMSKVLRLRKRRVIRRKPTVSKSVSKIASKSSPKTEHESPIIKLEAKRKQIQLKISIAKRKYHTREMSPESYKEILKEYEKQLVDVEADIESLEEGSS